MKRLFFIILTTTILTANSLKIHYYNKACNKDIAIACYQLGLKYLKKYRLKRENINAIVTFNKSCKLKYKKACAKLANMYEEGQATKKNKQKAKRYYKLACKLRDSYSCRKYTANL